MKITATLHAPLLGTMTRELRPSQLVVRHGDKVVFDSVLEDGGPVLDASVCQRDWADEPWFLGNISPEQESVFVGFGFDRTTRTVAAGALKKLFPHQVCKEMAADRDRLALIYGLYEPFAVEILNLLAVGVDLAQCAPWDHERLLCDLRNPFAFWGAQAEVLVRARLLRRGLKPDVEPAGQGEKRPDFVVHRDYGRTFIEVKTNPTPLSERRLRELQSAVHRFVSDLMGSDRFVVIRGTESLGDLFMASDPQPAIRANFKELYEGLDQATTTVKQRQFAKGVYPAGRLAEIEVQDRSEGYGASVQLDLWAGFSSEKLASRVIRKVRDASDQIPSAARGIVVVDVGGVTDLRVLQNVLMEQARARPRDFENIVLVIALVRNTTPDGFTRTVAVPLQVSSAWFTSAEHEIIEAILERPWNQLPEGIEVTTDDDTGDNRTSQLGGAFFHELSPVP